MSRTMTVVLAATLIAGAAGAALAASPEERCQSKKLKALGKRALCVKTQERKQLLGKATNFPSCEDKFQKALARAEKRTACRWLEHGDGTATDLNTGLQWELKTTDGTIHDLNESRFLWPGLNSDNDWVTNFLFVLNEDASLNGTASSGCCCFAGYCDWRIPTIQELSTLYDPTIPNCGQSPFPVCTTIPGESELHGASFWSSTIDPSITNFAWSLNFKGSPDPQDGPSYHLYSGSNAQILGMRAVRGGM